MCIRVCHHFKQWLSALPKSIRDYLHHQEQVSVKIIQNTKFPLKKINFNAALQNVSHFVKSPQVNQGLAQHIGAKRLNSKSNALYSYLYCAKC